MSNRWFILAVLFVARLSMAFQFQSIAALSPLVMDSYGIGLAEIGFLIGLYLAPGVVVALPGGAIAAWFGEKRIVALSLFAMLVGSILAVTTAEWGWLVAGRVLAGAGGVIVNIVMTKLLVDWFEGKEIATAMAIYVNSWPVGIALALFALPVIATFGGLFTAWVVVTGLIGAGLMGFVIYYHPAPGSEAAVPTITLRGLPFYTLILASLVWALYNSSLAMVFSFGPTLLNEMGWSLAAAGSATSAFMIVFAIALPIGGIIADKTGRRDTVILASLVGFALLLPLVPFATPVGVAAIFLVLGVLGALAAGPVMTLPSVVLTPANRTIGMGVFFTIYYGVVMVSPSIAGGLADRSGDVGLTFFLGSAIAVLAIVSLVLFTRATRPGAPAPVKP